MRKTLAVLLMLLILVPALCACEPSVPQAEAERKGIIWLTALLSGGLVDQAEGEPVWDPINSPDITLMELMDLVNADMAELSGMIVGLLNGSLELGGLDKGTIQSLINPIAQGKENNDNLLWRLTLDENGIPHDTDVVPANDFDGPLHYGIMQGYKEQIEELTSIYGDEYEVNIFNYDWRLDNRTSARQLEQFIETKGYTDVVLLAHSMGGAVVANYLARSQSNRDKVDAFISMGGTMAGSFDTWHAMEDMTDYLLGDSELKDFLYNGSLKSITAPLMNNVMGQLQRFVTSTDSFVQLLPSWGLLGSEQYDHASGKEGITVAGNAITNEEDMYAFYATRPWAWQRDAQGDVVYEADGTPVLRKVVQELRDYQHGLYVKMDDGSEVLSPTLVNTYYLTGKYKSTRIGADVDADGSKVSYRFEYVDGDAQVPLHSLIERQDPDTLKENGRLCVFEHSSHFSVGCDWPLIRSTVLSIIDSVSTTQSADVLAAQ